jgi:hypothetical protein
MRATRMNDFWRRALAAARLDPAVFAEVERDHGATLQALAIVLLSGAAAAVGRLGSFKPATLAAGMLVAVLGWVVWAGLCWMIGTRLVSGTRTRSDLGESVRVFGFAAAPGISQALGIIVPLRTPVLALAQIWMILAMVVAVRQALDYDRTARALGVCLAGWAAQLALIVGLLAVARPLITRRIEHVRPPADAVPTAGYLGVVKPSGVAPPVD